VSQLTEVLNHMQTKGAITSLDAINLFGATRLSAIIYDLRKKGHIINSVLVPVPTRHGKTTHVSSYTLENKNGNT
jgi:hypothetical protein